jgi:hypothetical protein
MAAVALSTQLSKLNRSGYRGVSWYSPYGKWRAQARLHGKHVFLGYFDDVHEAGIAASDFRLQHKEELEENQERGRRRKTKAVRARLADLTPEEQRQRVRDNFSGSREERSKRSKKGWETRRRTALA